MDIHIDTIAPEEAPMDLLLLADPSKELMQEYLEKGICYIAQWNNLTVGTVVIVEKEPQSYEIMNIAVSEKYRNRGIGKELLLFVIDGLSKEGAKSIEIRTGNSSIFQLLLYQKCGFRIIAIDFDYFRRNYSERIYENGIECRDQIRLRIDL